MECKQIIELQAELKQNILKAQINFKKSPRERITTAYVEARLNTLELYWSKFTSNHEQIITKTDKADRSHCEYFEDDVYCNVEESYYIYKGELNTACLKLNPRPSSSGEDNKSMHGDNVKYHSSDVKLPRIAIPTFSGNYTEWQSFYDLFTSLIHNNNHLDDVQKLHYLKSSLSGDAETLLRGVAVTAENYLEAWNILKKRYDNKRYVANSIFKKFFGQRNITQESAINIKQLLDTSVECINALKHIGLPTEYWDAIVIYIIVLKLDENSIKQWEETIGADNTEELPKLQKLTNFLETRFRTLEMVESTNLKPKTMKPKIFHVTVDQKCSYCKGKHFIYNCKDFVKLSIEKRYEFVQNNNLCFNCLIPNHPVIKCKQLTSCKICNKKHHSLIHPGRKSIANMNSAESEQEDPKEKDSVVAAHFSGKKQPGQGILLPTALIDVISDNSQFHVVRALLDQGSQASFITEKIVQTLGLKKTKCQNEVVGIGEGDNKLFLRNTVTFKLRSRYDTSFNLTVHAFVLRSITTLLPTWGIKGSTCTKIKDLPLADTTFNTPGRVDLLLGADVYSKVLDNGVVKGTDGVVAQFTRLGWILSGEVMDQEQTGQREVITMHIKTLDNDLLKKFWEIESDLGSKKKMLTKEEEICEQIYKTTTERDETGRYIVNIPLKQSPEETIATCGNTKDQAIRRFTHLENKFKRNHALKVDYQKVIKEYLELGHMVKIEEEAQSLYLPHHAIIREDKDTTKVRVVYDASAKGSKGYSLNDCMLIGPTLQPDLRTLLIKWRSYKICIVGDIVKMYRQINVAEEHSNLQCIVWRDEPEQPLQHFKLVTVTFGTAAAPFLAVRTLIQLAEDEGHKYHTASKILKDSLYMDDLMTGAETVEQAYKIYEEMNSLLLEGGFEMQKWSSNSSELLSQMKNKANNDIEKLTFKMEPIFKILGLTWNRQDDSFHVTVHLPELSNCVTKRFILSDISRLFDPFGWLSPVIITAKVFIQKLWLCRRDWDEKLPVNLINEWTKYRDELNNLETIMLPRWLKLHSNNRLVEIHGFADASTTAYAAVVYLRVVTEKEDISVNLIAAKTKVAPLKQISVPRLELCAAVLLARLLDEVRNILNISNDNVFAWTDSTVVLSWLQSPPSRWKTFVGNRVSEIIQLMDNDKWHHVKSSENPADPASRGISAQELRTNELWWHGPSWLRKENVLYERKHIPSTELEIKKNDIKVLYVSQEVPIWERFSNLSKLKRVLAYCRRLTFKRSETKSAYLTTNELKAVMGRCILHYQEMCFSEEIQDLKRHNKVKKRSKLRTLDPFIDKEGILRVGGRLEEASMSNDFKHPVIIPNKTYLMKLIIKDAHLKTMHGGPQLMMSYIRTSYWIFGLKSAVRRCARECTICIRHRGETYQQLMGQLPAVRVTPHRPFLNTGVDYAGPVQVKTSKGRGHKSTKGYICIFVCMCTKAVHLEVVSDLTSQGFIAAFRRFVARRGYCKNIWSDNGTNFIGAAKELKSMFIKTRTGIFEEIADILATDGTTWHFIPPKSPNFGGLWEAGVKSAKRHLTRVIGSATLSYEELATLLTQIEACLNSRPLFQLEGRDLNFLTPGHFLIGENLTSVPDYTDYQNCNVNLLTRWQLLQRMTSQFWKRWQLEYLHTMQQRYKWHSRVPPPTVDDMVIIKEEDVPPTKWLLGRIIHIHPGPDQLVRVVTVKCNGNTILKRPLSKLIFLPKENCA